jgi:hypothetical protein
MGVAQHISARKGGRQSAKGVSGETLIAAKTGEKSERSMLERVLEAPAQTLALRVSGTVMAGDVAAAIEAALGEAATGLVVIVDPDFDGEFAELARGLAGAALAHRSLVKLAVVIDPEQMDGPRLNSFEASPISIRQFAPADENSALEWAAAARRGE